MMPRRVSTPIGLAVAMLAAAPLVAQTGSPATAGTPATLNERIDGAASQTSMRTAATARDAPANHVSGALGGSSSFGAPAAVNDAGRPSGPALGAGATVTAAAPATTDAAGPAPTPGTDPRESH